MSFETFIRFVDLEIELRDIITLEEIPTDTKKAIKSMLKYIHRDIDNNTDKGDLI